MTQQTLMLIEASGIQPYIFGSNQLAQNIGASELVTLATTDWVTTRLPEPHNIVGGQALDREPGQELAAEVVYAGGGNAMILFAEEGEAERFARDLSRHVLQAAPGLDLVIQRVQFDPQQGVLRRLHQAQRGELAQRKLDRPLSAPLAGLGVTAACVFTGQPAVAVDGEGRLISAEVQAKLNHEHPGNERLRAQLPQVEAAGYDFIYDFGQLGSRGESSYLAVVHTDGNGMGRRIQAFGQEFDAPEGNEGYVRALRRFSASIVRAAENALDRTVDMLLDRSNLVKNKLGGVVPIPLHQGRPRLPFRPIVYGGDDVTFVCEGRLGLAVAARYLAEFSDQFLADGRPAHARAGMAVVRTHYPFSRAYDLAEDLCRSAKDYILDAEEEQGLTALDWHFAVGGLVLPLKEVRVREYQASQGSLLMRPLRLTSQDGDWRAWQTFVDILAEFQKPESQGGRWAGRRNKLKALRDALRSGPEATQLFLAGEELPPIRGRADMKTYGWQGGACGYFDALEALDFYVPLDGGRAP